MFFENELFERMIQENNILKLCSVIFCIGVFYESSIAVFRIHDTASKTSPCKIGTTFSIGQVLNKSSVCSWKNHRKNVSRRRGWSF